VGLRLGVSGDATRDLTDAEHALVIRAAASSCKALAATDDGKKLYDTTLDHYRLQRYFRPSSSIGSGGSGAVDQCIDVYERTPPSKQGALKRNIKEAVAKPPRTAGRRRKSIYAEGRRRAGQNKTRFHQA